MADYSELQYELLDVTNGYFYKAWLSSVYHLSCLGFIATQLSLSALRASFISKIQADHLAHGN